MCFLKEIKHFLILHHLICFFYPWGGGVPVTTNAIVGSSVKILKSNIKFSGYSTRPNNNYSDKMCFLLIVGWVQSRSTRIIIETQQAVRSSNYVEVDQEIVWMWVCVGSSGISGTSGLDSVQGIVSDRQFGSLEDQITCWRSCL